MPRSRLLSMLVPPGVSLAVHLALLAVVAAVSITAIRMQGADDPGSDVVVTLENVGIASAEAAPPSQGGVASAAEALAPGVPIPAVGAEAGDLSPPPITLAPGVAPSPLPSSATATTFRRTAAPGAAFAGLSASRVRRVVYVVDISGPMASSLRFVLDELQRSVSRLDSSQQFQVILFQQEPEATADAGALWLTLPGDARGAGPRLLPATAANRAALAAFLDGVRPSGRSNPMAGLRPALSLEPDAIFLLARGISRTGPNARWGEGNAVILQVLDSLNPQQDGRRATAIKTIQFIDDDPTGLMQAIAAAHGGGPDSYSRRGVQDLEQAATALPLVEALDADLDRAAALMSELSASRVDLRVLWGRGTPQDVATARRVAGQVVELIGGREGSVGADDLTRLVLGRALVLRAAAGASEAGAGEASAGLGPTIDRAIALLDTSDGAPPEVLATAASALALRGGAGDADRVRALARRVIEAEPWTILALEARLAAIAATAGDSEASALWVGDLELALARSPVVVAGRLDGPLALLSLDASAAARLPHASSAAEIDAALALHLNWARSPLPGLPGEAVLLSAGRLAPESAPLDQIDPDLALARGLALLPESGGRPSEGALRALDAASARGGPGSMAAEMACIRAAMAVSLWASGESGGGEAGGATTAREDAIRRLDRALRDYPGRAWRRDAAVHLLAHTSAVMDAGGAVEPGVEESRRRALRVLVVDDPRPEARTDAWRVELAHRAAASDSGDGEALAEALALLEGPWISRPAEATRLEAWVRSSRVAQLSQDLSAAVRTARPSDARRIAMDLAAAAREAIPVVQGVSADAADALRGDLAEALIVQQSPEAAEIYSELRLRGATLGRVPGVVALGEARALLAQGDEAGAFAVLRELTGSMPEPPVGPDGGDADADAAAVFWQAWTLTIEVLADRRRTVADEQARLTGSAHLLRLHSLDPGLGGEPWSSRLRAAGLSLGVSLPDEGT